MYFVVLEYGWICAIICYTLIVHSVVFWFFLCNLNVKMASDKIKVAVRVRPFNRRGKLVSITIIKKFAILLVTTCVKNYLRPLFVCLITRIIVTMVLFRVNVNALRGELLKYMFVVDFHTTSWTILHNFMLINYSSATFCISYSIS